MFASLGAYGHVYPMMPLALAFADAGHEVVTPTMIAQCERIRPDLMIFEGMDTGAGVAASVLGIPGSVYATLHSATVGYQRDMWLQWDRTPPDANRLLAGALINPAPPSLGRTDGIGTPTIPIRSVAYNESSAGVPAWLTQERTRPPGLPHARNGVVRGGRGTQSCDC